MLALISYLKSLIKREEGQTLSEYALILVLIAIAVIVMLTGLGTAIGNILTQIASSL